MLTIDHWDFKSQSRTPRYPQIGVYKTAVQTIAGSSQEIERRAGGVKCRWGTRRLFGGGKFAASQSDLGQAVGIRPMVVSETSVRASTAPTMGPASQPASCFELPLLAFSLVHFSRRQYHHFWGEASSIIERELIDGEF